MKYTTCVSESVLLLASGKEENKKESPGPLVCGGVCKSSPGVVFPEHTIWGLCIENRCSRCFFRKHFPQCTYKAEIVKLFILWSLIHFFLSETNELTEGFMW